MWDVTGTDDRERMWAPGGRRLAVLKKPWLQTRRKETLPWNQVQTEPDPFSPDHLEVLGNSMERGKQSKLNALHLDRDIQR